MRMMFLLGAGTSLPAGMPDTPTLTQAALDPTRYALLSSHTFARASPASNAARSWREDAPQLQDLLEFVQRHCQAYFDQEKDKVRLVNYEDLYFALSQLDEHLTQEYENPAIECFGQTAMKHMRLPHAALQRLTGLACNYIRDVICIELARAPRTCGHLQCLLDAITDPTVKRWSIATLNHDLLLDKSLGADGVRYTDGFGPTDHDVAWWEPAVFESAQGSLLLKLHGSINWHEYDNRTAKLLGHDADHAYRADGTMLPVSTPGPLLIGTFNKLRHYYEDPYATLFAVFRRELAHTHVLIINGYSFGDKGINTIISDWLRRTQDTRIIVLHQHAEACLAAARGAIRQLWHKYRERRMHVHDKYLNETSWAALRRVLQHYGAAAGYRSPTGR